jgi:glutamyl-tRNA reductase
MVVGEPQILGQVKEAYQRAVQAGTIGRVLSKLMERALAVAKKVRSETAISQNPVSVSSVAVDLTGKIFGDLASRTVLLVGAGDMAELAARCLMNAGADRLVVTNRTAERAEAIASEFRGAAVSFEALYDVLPAVDIVICSTGAPDFVIKQAEARRALKARRKGPILFIDISVPRNIDPEISSLENCFVFNIDDLQTAVEANRIERHREAQVAETIIEAEVDQFVTHLRALDIGPSVIEVKQMLSEIALRELRRNRKHLGGITPDQEAAIRDVLIPALVNKLSHPVIVHLRAAARDGARSSVADELRKMIRLD